MRGRSSRISLALRPGYAITPLIALTAFAAAAGLGLTSRTHVPTAAIAVANSFIDRINVGDLQTAHRLTGRNAPVGTSLAEFEAKLRRQLAIDTFPLHRSATFAGLRAGGQSYGNRLRRWIMGRTVDPDTVDLDYSFGVPFEIRLASDERGNWHVVLFQSHAA
ncbi:MAG TPA: hypothetical protein VKX28_24745 [Xanthobacteraceae bacterium]|nr:hypothetical protein [Xanthobacteraceae bacterium]